MPRIAVYGASGYTGRLVLAALGVGAGADAPPGNAGPGRTPAGAHEIVAVGRDAGRLRAAAPGAEARVAPLGDPDALRRAFADCAVVISCAGPFGRFGRPVLEAAIEAGASYADTAAEQAWVHEVHERYGPAAAAGGVALLPAAGLDFVPGDLACALAGAGLGPLAGLEVGYAIDSFRLTRGSVSSALAGIAERPLERSGGALRFAPRIARPRRFDFPPPFGRRAVAPFPAGEVITAPRHLDVAAVRTVVAARTLTLGVEPLGAAVAPLVPLAGAVVRGPLARAAGRVVELLPEGPAEDGRRRARWIVVAAARARDGRTRRIAVRGTDVYGTTAAIAARAAEELAADAPPGALPPAVALAPEAFLARVGLAAEAV